MNQACGSISEIIDALDQQGETPALLAIAAPQACRSRAQLREDVRRLAAGLVSFGIQPGEVVALLADNRADWIVAALAAIRSGATVLPIDTQVGATNLRHILEDSGCRLAFVNAEQSERIQGLGLDRPPRLSRLDQEDGGDSWRALRGGTDAALPAPDSAANAILFYTSGTTGPPKGVPLTHGNICFQLREIAQVELVRPDDRLLLPLPLHHVYPFVIGMLAPLFLRLPVILPRSLTGPEILRAINEGEVSAIIGVPRLYRALHAGIESQVSQQGLLARAYIKSAWALSAWLRQRLGINAGKTLLAPLHRKFGPTLRLLASGGSALDADLARRLEGLGWDIGIGYGLTETSPLLTLNLPGSGKLESVGQPLPGVELRIVREDTPADEADGTRAGGASAGGEVQVRGPNVFHGYWQAPDKTRESFTADGWYRTGDLGRLDAAGYLHLQGRASTLIVTESGKNIQPDEVEEQYAAHAWIAEIGVLEDAGRLVALVIGEPRGVALSGLGEAAALKQAVGEQSRKLPSYQRLSDFAVSREALPRTRLGKIQRHRLVERYRQARAEAAGSGAIQAGPIDFADMSDQDQALMEDPNARRLWQWLAGRYPELRLTPDTSPALDLNIDSMEMINLTMEISRLTGVELDQQALGRVESVRDLIQEVVHQGETGGAGLDPERIFTSPEDYLSEQQRRWLKPLGPGVALIPRLARPVLLGLMKALFRLRVEGLEHLPDDRPFVLAPNHVSVLDPALLFVSVPYRLLRRSYFAGWTGMAFKNRPMRFIARMGQTVPIDAQRAAASSLALGATVLKQGNNLIWFPEGERSMNGELKPFKPGIGLLLKHYRVSVIPVHIEGAYQAMPRGQRLPHPHRIRVRFGAPVAPDSLIDSGSEREIHAQISDGLQRRLAQLIETEQGPGHDRTVD